MADASIKESELISSRYAELLNILKEKIRSSQINASISVNTELIKLYPEIGLEIVQRQKEEGGETKVIDNLAKDLKTGFPQMAGFSSRNPFYMKQFAEYTYRNKIKEKLMKFLLVTLITLHQICFAQTFQDPNRVQILTNGLPLHGIGIEIAPFFRPTLLKEDYNIFYTDYTTASELIKKHEHLPIAQQIRENTVPVDFLWLPGKILSNCVGGTRFHYAIASHVIEHVPDVLGWIIQILDVLHPGGILSLAVPDKRYTFDAYRSETEAHDLIDSWLRSPHAPTPGQIFDMLSRSCDVPSDHPTPSEEEIPFEILHRNYTDQEALHHAFHAYKSGNYLDIHCSVFTPENFRKIFLKINELGILNVSISEPISNEGEFFIQFTKLGDPPVRR